MPTSACRFLLAACLGAPLIVFAATPAAPGSTLTPAIAATVAGATSTATPTATPPVIRSQAELDAYLRAVPAGSTPLDALPASARQRFLGGLSFAPAGLASFELEDLDHYLTLDQGRAVLALFGVHGYAADSLKGRARPLTPEERDRPASDIERRFNRMHAANEKHDNAREVELYDALLAPLQRASLEHVSDNDLYLLWRGANSATFWSPTPSHLRDMQRDLAEFRRRGVATPDRVQILARRLIAARDFDAARKLAADYPDAKLDPVPDVQTSPQLVAGAPSMLSVRDDAPLLRESVDMSVPLRIVVVASCHFSQDAARAISADAKLDRLFRDHAIWLANEQESLELVRDWNRQFPSQPIHVAWQESEWRMLDSWAMPTFYVFRRGKLVSQWDGWPSDKEGMARLHAGLDKAGVEY